MNNEAVKNRILRHFSSRKSILKKLPKNSVGAELGVFLGEFAKEILLEVKPQKLYLVDPYEKLSSYYGDWANSYNDGMKLSTKKAREIAENKLTEFDNFEFIVADDIEFLKQLEDNHLDWVYIDSSHLYEHTLKELILCRDKVKSGGIISGHDYVTDRKHKHYGVYKAISEFCSQHNLKVSYTDAHSQWLIKND